MDRPKVLALLLILAYPGCDRSHEIQSRGAISVQDDLDRTVVLPKTPARIISLAPSITETLFALGLDSSIVGVTEFCDFPDRARSKRQIGGIMNPSMERIVALDPDLVIMSVSGNARSDFDKLVELKTTVFVTNPKSVEGIFKSIMDLGRVTGTEGTAEILVRQLRTKRDSLVASARTKPRLRVLLFLSLSPVIAAGPGSFLDELLSLANSWNAAGAAPTAYPMLSREEILRLRPHVLLATSDVVKSVDQIASAYPEWNSLDAVRSERLAIIDANIVTRPGPRIIEGLKSLIDAIHRYSSRS